VSFFAVRRKFFWLVKSPLLWLQTQTPDERLASLCLSDAF
jgi:hypothetical protein